MSNQWSVLDLSEGFHLAHAVAALQDENVLASLGEYGATAEELAVHLALDYRLLQPILQFVAERTDIIDWDGEKYLLTSNYNTGSRFLLDQYVRAYGANASKLPTLLHDPSAARGLVDQRSQTKAYDEIDGPGVFILPDLIKQFGFNFLLDIGCGPCSLLLDLAKEDTNFIGWGIDISPTMHDAGMRRIKAANLEKRVTVFLGNCTDLPSVIPKGITAQVQTIVASSLLNEFFAVDSARAITWLKELKECFPGRKLLIADYYGCLSRRAPPWPRLTALHDFVQVISGQGVPPSSLAEWQDIYTASGCELVHVVEDYEASCFVHFIRL